MAKKDKNNSKQKRGNHSAGTGLPDVKANAQTSNKGASMKQEQGGN